MSDVQTEVDGDVWRITLDRPEAGNALTPRLAEELAAAFSDRPEETRTVLLLGNGPRFCVGGDVQSFARPTIPARSSGSSPTTGTRSSGCCSTPRCPWWPASTVPWPGPASV